MFPPENDEGNTEYKRHLCSEELKSFDSDYNIRFQQLITQMKFRLGEGNGIAIYYIGVEDDGSFYGISKEEIKKSVDVLKKMVTHIDAKVDSILLDNYNDYNYIKAVIKDKVKSSIKPEKRILLLGDTESGKTTFLAYIIKNKLDTELCKARLYILNHKHEIENGKTTSFNYQFRNYQNMKIAFIDTPGDKISFSKSNRIRNKIILSFDYDLILFFNKSNEEWENKEMYIKYAKYMNIPYIDINLFEEKSFINLINPIEQNEMMEYFIKDIKKEEIIKKENESNFYLLQSFPHIDMGWILSGFLNGKSLKVGMELYWYDYNMIPVKIKSIYKNNIPVNKIYGPSTITITLEDINSSTNMISNKPRFGFLSENHYDELKKLKLVWIYFNDSEIMDYKNISISVSNQYINLQKNDFYYDIINTNNYEMRFNLINKLFIYENKDKFGFGKVIC